MKLINNFLLYLISKHVILNLLKKKKKIKAREIPLLYDKLRKKK